MKSEETGNLQLLIIVLVIVGAFSLIYNFFIKKEDTFENKEPVSTISVLNDYNRFFTVSSCASKFINYLTTKNTDNLLILLSDEYKEDNNINSNNLYNYIGSIDGNKTFSARKMFEEKMNNNIYKYYVYGSLQEEVLGKVSKKEDYYLVIILDENNMTFAVEPYTGDLFKQEDNNE